MRARTGALPLRAAAGALRTTRRPPRLAVALAAAVVAFAVLVRWQPGGAHLARAVDDVGQLLAAALAAAACAVTARRCEGRARTAWLLLAAATACWALGETAWSYYEVVAGRATPFPSAADAGYLLFDLLAVVGIASWPSAALHGGARWRALLDGVLVAGALFIVSWVTALGQTVRVGGDSSFAYAVSLGYPVMDLVLLTLTVVAVAHSRATGRTGLSLLAAGLACLCLADSGFAYLQAEGRYSTGSIVDVGWFAGFLLLALAAHLSRATDLTAPTAAVESTAKALLPYAPAGLGLAVAVAGEFSGRVDRVALAAATAVMAALLARQLLAVLDNRRLLRQVLKGQEELHHQAFHDPLTGLANRALFADRLHHGVELHRRDLRPLAVVYCDLDGFKTVNDTLGHAAGDSVLLAAAERLRAVTRAGDTVARMGGDEFAVLLEDGGDVAAVVGKVLEAFRQPASVNGRTVPLATSIGVAQLTAGAATVTPEVLLQRADAAMYTAKRRGKAQAVFWSGEPEVALTRMAQGGAAAIRSHT